MEIKIEYYESNLERRWKDGSRETEDGSCKKKSYVTIFVRIYFRA